MMAGCGGGDKLGEYELEQEVWARHGKNQWCRAVVKRGGAATKG